MSLHWLPAVGLWMPPGLERRWKEPFFRAWFDSVEVHDTPEYYKGFGIETAGYNDLSPLPGSAALTEQASLPAEADQPSETEARELAQSDEHEDISEGLIMRGSVKVGYLKAVIKVIQPLRSWLIAWEILERPPTGWWVLIHEDREHPWHLDLYFDVARIFLASGCRRVLRFKPARSMWLCSAELCKDWDQILLPLCGAYVGYKRWLRPSRSDQGETKCIYSTGLARRGLGRVYVYTGPGIDPQTGAERHYIALDYDSNPVRLLSNVMLHGALQKKLASLGCLKVPLRKFRKPWEEEKEGGWQRADAGFHSQ